MLEHRNFILLGLSKKNFMGDDTAHLADMIQDLKAEFAENSFQDSNILNA